MAWRMQGALVALLVAGLCWTGTAAQAADEEPMEVAQATDQAQEDRAQARRAGLESITVTARKVEEDLQTTPVSITAFTADDLTGNDVTEIKDLGMLTPNMRFENVPGTGATATITVRGISQADLLITGDPSVGVYIDGVYNARIIGANFHLLDTERVEVLKGPQGTLYGRNTPAGALNVWSRKPDGTFGGWARVTLGEDSRQDLEGAVQFPILGESLSARIAFQSQYREGYIDNKGDQIDQSIFGTYPTTSTDDIRDRRNKGVRGTLRWVPGDSTEMLLRGYYQQGRGKHGNPHTIVAVNANVPDDPFFGSAVVTPTQFDVPTWIKLAADSDSETTFMNNNGREDVDYAGGSFEINQDIGENHGVKYIVGHRDYTLRRHTDSDGMPFKIFHSGEPWDPVREKSRQHTQDLTFSGLLFGERLQYTAGAYYFEERSSTQANSYFGHADFLFPGATFGSGATLASKIRAWALYGEGNYALTEKLGLTLGIRTTYERRKARRKTATCTEIPAFGVNTCPAEPTAVVGGKTLDDRWDAVTWTTGLQYQFTDELFGYLKVSKGYRSGGWNGRFNADPSTQKPYGEEKVTTYEAGVKSEWLDRRVRTNFSGFWSKYKALQSTSLVPCSIGICTVIQNTGSVNVRGFEFEMLTSLFDGFNFNATVGLTDREFINGPRSGGMQTFNPGFGPEPTSEAEPANSPRWQYTLTAKYTFPEFELKTLPRELSGILSARLDYAWQSDNYGSGDNGRKTFPFNLSDRVRQQSYGILNGRIGMLMPPINTEVAFFVRNIFDKEYFAGGVDWAGSAGFGQWSHSYAPGRKWGVEVTYRWGSDAL